MLRVRGGYIGTLTRVDKALPRWYLRRFPLNLMPPFLAELLGTMLLIVLGDGVVANVVLNKTKGQNGGWIVITAGWAFGVMIAVYAVGTFSRAHLDPPGTIRLASIRKFAWANLPMYVAAPGLGALPVAPV